MRSRLLAPLALATALLTAILTSPAAVARSERASIAGQARHCAVHGPIKVCGRLTFYSDGYQLGSIRLRDLPGGPDVSVGVRHEQVTELQPTASGLVTVQTTSASARIWDPLLLTLDVEALPAVHPCDVWRVTAMVGVRRHGDVRWTERRLVQGRDPVGCSAG